MSRRYRRREAAKQSTLQAVMDYGDDMRRHAARQPTLEGLEPAACEPLTEQERRVLHLVEIARRCRGRAAEEIRQELERYAQESRN